MSRKEYLIKTKELLIEKGWTQSIRTNHEGKKCITQALTEAYGLDYFVSPYSISTLTNIENYCSYIETFIYLTRKLNKILYVWNDEKERTKEEVLEFLQKAIDSCE